MRSTDTTPLPLWRALVEASVFVVPALLLSTVLAWGLGRHQCFVGTPDLMQIFAQGYNLLWVWSTGDAISNRAFLGLPTPYTYSPSEHEFSLPLLALSHLTNPWFAYDVLLFAVMIANGVAMYVLLRVGGLQRLTSVFGGIVYLWAPTTLLRSVHHVYLAQIWFLPVLLLPVLADRRDGFRCAHWAICGAIAALMAAAHEYLGLLGLGMIAISLACSARRLGAWRLVGAVAAVMASFIAVEAPVLWTYWAQHAYDQVHGVVFERPLEQSVALSCTFSDYLLPSRDNPVWQGFPWGGGASFETFNYLGVVNLAALTLGVGLWLLRRDRLCALLDAAPLLRTLRCEFTAIGVAALVFSFGPRWSAAPWVRLPVDLLRALPPFSMVRGWGRFGFVVFFVVTVLTACLADGLLRRVGGRWPRVLVLVAMGIACLDQLVTVDVPVFRVPLPAVTSRMAGEPGDFLVLNLPFCSQTGPLHNGVAQVLQPFHGKRTVNGYTAFANPSFTGAVVGSPLRALDLAFYKSSSPVSTDDFGRWLAAADIRFIVYERQTTFYYPPIWSEAENVRLRVRTERLLRDLVASGALRIVEDDDDYTVYQLVGP